MRVCKFYHALSQQVKGARFPEALLSSAQVNMLLMVKMVDIDIEGKKGIILKWE